MELQAFTGESIQSLAEYLPTEQSHYIFKSPAEHRFARIVVRLHNAIDEENEAIIKPTVRRLVLFQRKIQ